MHKDNKLQKSVLLIEDDRSIREATREALEFFGYRVITASNGREGLEVLREEKPNLVLLDLMMPIMGGREFLSIFLANEEWAQIPVVILSAVAGMENTTGAKAFLKKPADLDDLIDTVELYAEPIAA